MRLDGSARRRERVVAVRVLVLEGAVEAMDDELARLVCLGDLLACRHCVILQYVSAECLTVVANMPRRVEVLDPVDLPRCHCACAFLSVEQTRLVCCDREGNAEAAR